MLAALLTCAALSAQTYHVPPDHIQRTMTAAEAIPAEARGVGPMGIPAPWLPVLKMAGFDIDGVVSDPCQGVIAGTWILAYQAQWAEARMALTTWKIDNLPKEMRERAQKIQPDVAYAASLTGVPVELINAVIQQESGFNTFAVSSANASGLMQLMPATARRFGVTNVRNARQNIVGGTQYLRWLLIRFKGNLELALAGYNAGEGKVDKYGGIPPYRQTRAYVPSVIARYKKFLKGGQFVVAKNP